MKSNTLKKILLGLSFITPTLSFAALDGVRGLLTTLAGFMNQIISVIFGLCLVYFFWGLSQFILHSAEPKVLEEGKKKMIWGVVALFVFVSIYGLINFISGSLGLTSTPGGQNGSGINSDPWVLGCAPENYDTDHCYGG